MKKQEDWGGTTDRGRPEM
uniref:Uncharacterized protein n=1 Tax=Arundo donax TaxID=35708 RepID=A0A0A9BFA9_ARUDO